MAFKCATKVCSMSPKDVTYRWDYKYFRKSYKIDAEAVWQIFVNVIDLIHSSTPESGSRLSFLDQWSYD